MTSLLLFSCLAYGYVIVSAEITVIDLTHTLGPKSVGYPGHPRLNFTNIHRGDIYPGVWVEYNWFSVGEHIGTHFDAPRHFCKQGRKAHEIPIERLVGPAVVINATAESENNLDFEVTNETLIEWERNNIQIPDNAFVFFMFGWDERYPNWQRTFNPTHQGGQEVFHFPGLGYKAAEWLVTHRNINAVGTDTPSPDLGTSKAFPVHRVLCKNEIVIIENVAGLNKMPPWGAMAYGGAIKLKNGSGGPIRLFATVGNSAKILSFSSILFVFTVCFTFA